MTQRLYRPDIDHTGNIVAMAFSKETIMAKTVTALYENYPQANSAVEDLVKHDFRREDISLMAQEASTKDGIHAPEEEAMSGTATGLSFGAAIGGVGGLVLGLSALAIPGIGPIIAAGPIVAALVGAGVGAAAGGLIGVLTDLGVPEEEAHYYAEGVRRGGVLLTVHAADNMAERAASILSTHHPIDLPQRVDEWRKSGWSRFDAAAEPSALAPPTPASTRTPDKTSDARAHTVATPSPTREHERTLMHEHETAKETTIPTVEEASQVDKRQTERDVHVRTSVTETPGEETVRLRQEHVTVERRPVDRQARPSDGEAFKEQTITVTESGEEAVVSKQARVVDAVVVRKEAAEHTETVKGTMRRTEVQVDRLGTAPQRDSQSFEGYDADFRRHYGTAFATTSGATYERYMPAYRYGYTLATDPRYVDRDWAAIGPEARRSWEEHHAGTWEQFQDAIRHAWDTVTGRHGALV